MSKFYHITDFIMYMFPHYNTNTVFRTIFMYIEYIKIYTKIYQKGTRIIYISNKSKRNMFFRFSKGLYNIFIRTYIYKVLYKYVCGIYVKLLHNKAFLWYPITWSCFMYTFVHIIRELLSVHLFCMSVRHLKPWFMVKERKSKNQHFLVLFIKVEHIIYEKKRQFVYLYI